MLYIGFLSCPFWSTIRQRAWFGKVLGADTHHKLLDRVVNGACVLTGCVFEFNIAHRLSVAVL